MLWYQVVAIAGFFTGVLNGFTAPPPISHTAEMLLTQSPRATTRFFALTRIRNTACTAVLKPTLLSGRVREEALRSLVGWDVLVGRDAIQKHFVFDDFVEAFGFMTKVAIVCEKMDHHPEWHNIYNRVDVILVTHDCNGLSRLDIDLARKMDKLYRSDDKVA